MTTKGSSWVCLNNYKFNNFYLHFCHHPADAEIQSGRPPGAFQSSLFHTFWPTHPGYFHVGTAGLAFALPSNELPPTNIGKITDYQYYKRNVAINVKVEHSLSGFIYFIFVIMFFSQMNFTCKFKTNCNFKMIEIST